MARANWSREELILAFNLYCKTPFGKIHIRNPQIIELARVLGRTPSAVSWKLANFARLDPSLKARHIQGAQHGAKLEQVIWNEFNENWNELSFESEQLLERFSLVNLMASAESNFPEGKSRAATVMVRVNQSFFRSAVLAAYHGRCCITGICVSSLLNASHIVPWCADTKNRTNPRNGLCLNALHDRAFDIGLLTVTPDYHVRISRKIADSNDKTLRAFIGEFENRRITAPERFLPNPKFLEYHNQHVFVGD
jgi:putative restriction endonuclease